MFVCRARGGGRRTSRLWCEKDDDVRDDDGGVVSDCESDAEMTEEMILEKLNQN